jgi:hypothetical protein
LAPSFISELVVGGGVEDEITKDCPRRHDHMLPLGTGCAPLMPASGCCRETRFGQCLCRLANAFNMRPKPAHLPNRFVSERP